VQGTNHVESFFMACRFSHEEVSGQNQVKSSVQRKIRQSIADQVSGEALTLIMKGIRLWPLFWDFF
jgi:hypothetical protein